MKFTGLRCSGFVVLIGCCITMPLASTATATVATWMQLSPVAYPPARSYLAMTYDAAIGKIIMFGGYDGVTYLNDTWLFDGVSWTRAIGSRLSPGPRANAQMAYDSVTHKVVLFGGYNGTRYLGDTWIWDGTTFQWTCAYTPHSPPAVTGPMLFPDPNGRVDVYG